MGGGKQQRHPHLVSSHGVRVVMGCPHLQDPATDKTSAGAGADEASAVTPSMDEATATAASAVLAVVDETASEIGAVATAALAASAPPAADAPIAEEEEDAVPEVMSPPLRCAQRSAYASVQIPTAQLLSGRGLCSTAQTVCIAVAEGLHREH